MNWLRSAACLAPVAAVLLMASAARADTVLLIPARGQVPGKLITGNIAYETRYVMAETGHSLVDDTQTQASILQVPDHQPDNADEFALLAKVADASWVVLPTISETGNRYRLELTAYWAPGGRVESVARDIDVNAVHQQILEMAKVLLRPEGVGTGALPWETSGPVASTPQPETHEGTTPPQARPIVIIAGAGLGVSAAVDRPSGATGSSVATFGALRAGLGLGESLELSIGFRGHLSGPRAIAADASGRYLVPLDAGGRVRLGPELGLGAFVQQGGAKQTSLMLRVNAVASVEVSGPVSVEAALGDLAWIPASAGTLVLGGGAVYGVARF